MRHLANVLPVLSSALEVVLDRDFWSQGMTSFVVISIATIATLAIAAAITGVALRRKDSSDDV